MRPVAEDVARSAQTRLCKTAKPIDCEPVGEQIHVAQAKEVEGTWYNTRVQIISREGTFVK